MFEAVPRTLALPLVSDTALGGRSGRLCNGLVFERSDRIDRGHGALAGLAAHRPDGYEPRDEADADDDAGRLAEHVGSSLESPNSFE